MIFTASTISGSISAGNPITISSSTIPENVLEPSQPSEKFGFPVRYVCATASEQTDWIPENSAYALPHSRNNEDCASFSMAHGFVTIRITCGVNGVFSRGAYMVA